MNHSLRKQPGIDGFWLSLLLGAATALALFLPFLVVDRGFFLYCGDFNEQQIPFYMYANYFIKQGGGTWSWATDMGSSFVNSYSFYNLGSPFLWISMIVPSRWMPFMMVPLFLLKFGTMSAAAYLYLQRYAKTRNMAVICSLVYAFCGFNVYNIFFNHMLESAIIFPLMLWAMDAFIYDGTRGAFAVFVGLSLVNNYFFFIGNVVFIILYFFTKLILREYKITNKVFLLLVFEAVLGVGLGMVLALPSLLNLMGNPRIENFANGMDLVMYGRVQQYWAIITSMFLPQDPPYLPNLFPDAIIKWTSMSFYLPVVSMAGVIAFSRHRKGGSTKILLFISFVMALVPILNSSFYAFNASYYARWYYMPALIAALATMHSLEQEDIDLEKGVKTTMILTGLFGIFGLLPTKVDDVWKLGVAEDARRFWLTYLTAMLGIFLFWVVVKYFRGKARFAPLLLGIIMGFSVFYSIIHISLGKFPQWERDGRYREMQFDGSAILDLPEGDFYRLDTYETHDNLGLWIDKSNIRTFNSVVTTSIMEFYPIVGEKRDVSSKPSLENYALRGLLGVKYTLTPTDQMEAFLSQPGVQGWKLWQVQEPYAIYENENFVPMGFTYDQYVHMDYLQAIQQQDRAPVLMRAIGLDSEQISQYRQYFKDEAIVWNVQEPAQEGEEQPGGWYQYDPVSFERYVEDCARRRETSSYSFTADSSGFTSKIKLDQGNLVFFGVPYDPGFTATVNGQEAEVLRVSGGMMAVFAPTGDNTIVFTYRTPGFMPGVIITLLCLGILLAYLVLLRLWKKQMQKAALTAAQPPLEIPVSQPEALDLRPEPTAPQPENLFTEPEEQTTTTEE